VSYARPSRNRLRDVVPAGHKQRYAPARCDEGNAAYDQKPKSKEFLGGYAEGVTPVPIPNTEVKPLRADGTARVAVWESRSPPGIKQRAPATRNGCGGSARLGSWEITPALL
jgi:hypothetical protein